MEKLDHEKEKTNTSLPKTKYVILALTYLQIRGEMQTISDEITNEILRENV